MTRARIPRTALVLLLLTPAACDGPPELPDRHGSSDPSPVSPHDALAAAPTPLGVAIPAASQITVDDAEQLDPFDLTALHVPVPAGQEAVVQARAAALLAVADPTTLHQPAIVTLGSAQRLAAEIAHADVVATANVIAVTPFVLSDGSPTELLEVTFTVDVLLHGPMTVTWSSRLPETASCGPTAPAVGDEVLVFLDVGPASVELRIGAPFVPVVAGTVTLHGLTLGVTELATVIQQNPETT